MNVRERRILIERFAVSCSIGILPHEKAAPQTVLVDAVLDLNSALPAGDTIESVLDYDFFRHEVQALVAARHFNLQETLCQAIAAFCLERKEVAAVRVTTRKPEAYPDCEAVGYQLYCTR